MKKLLYILGFLMISSIVLKPLYALGQEQFSGKEEDVPFSSARIFSKLVEATGANPNADWSDSFGATSEEDIGKDLYVMIYEKTINAPQEEAFKQSAAKYGMTEAELVRILHNDYSPLIAKKPGLRQEELQFKIAEIQQEYKKNRELRELEANIKAGVEPTEIFANGDLSDSGFDLINDLQMIEKLLFLKSNPIDIGKSYNSPSGGLSNQGQAGGTQNMVTGPDGTKNPPGQVTSGLSEGTKAASNVGIQTNADAAAADFNANVCFAEDEYGAALDAFEAKKQTDANYKDTSSLSDITNQNSSNLSSANDFLPAITGPETPPAQAAPADEWLKEPVCNDVFCLKVNYVKRPATSQFANSDNCIACHVEKANDVLKTVITHSLVPSKAPGNLGESAECKKAMATAFSSVSMNFYAVSMPVKTPLNDDIIYGTNIEDDWQNFCEAVAYFPFDACKEVTTSSSTQEYVPPPVLEDRATKDALTDAPENATYEDVTQRISDIVQGYQIQSANEQKRLADQETADESIVFFHPLRVEMDLMNQYFMNISNLLQSLHEEVEGVAGTQACTDIKNKKECE